MNLFETAYKNARNTATKVGHEYHKAEHRARGLKADADERAHRYKVEVDKLGHKVKRDSLGARRLF